MGEDTHKIKKPLIRGAFLYLLSPGKKERFQHFVKTLCYHSMPELDLSTFCA
jgi:response regulator of citrate/malate metabolism